MLDRIWSSCAHQFSWPRRADDGTYYQVCLQCGVRYAYDWNTMRRTVALENDAAPTAKPSKRAAAERRPRVWRPRERRLGLVVPVAYRASGASEWLKGTTRNLSRSGLLMCTEQPVPSGTALEFAFEMPAEISGQVASRVLCQGVAVRAQADKNAQGFLIATTIADYRFLQNDAVLTSISHRVRLKGSA